MADRLSSAFCVQFRCRTKSENNMHGHWKGQWQRSRSQRTKAYEALTIKAKRPDILYHAKICITRIAPRELDGDNLQGALKAIRDGVTDWLSGGYKLSNRKGGINDRDSRLQWEYRQEKPDEPKKYSIRIEIVWTGDTIAANGT